MSIQDNIYINGLDSILLRNNSYSCFEDCITHRSLRIKKPQQQRDLVIYKYIPLKYLLVLLKEKKLILKRIASWEDPYENFFLKQQFTIPKCKKSGTRISVEDEADRLFGMSWSVQEETDSLWRIYSPDRMSVRISTTIETLVETICSEDDLWDVWMGKVQYKKDEEINQWLSLCKNIKKRKQFFERISKSFFIKRKAFSAEKEYRIVINYARQKSSSVCFLCEPEKLITSFLIDPRVTEYEFEAIKVCLISFGVSKEKIAKSNLYFFKPQLVEMDYNIFHDFLKK